MRSVGVGSAGPVFQGTTDKKVDNRANKADRGEEAEAVIWGRLPRR